MDVTTLLARLKLSLPLTSDAYDALLTNFLKTAIGKFGADVTQEQDQTLVILYAGWLWRSQKEPGLGKPPALQMAINDRAVRRATEGGDV
nr:MAG TPA: hypothetical protein [Caudoviricetes sp.]